MTYRVLDGLDLDNRAYVAGDTVAIDDDAIAAALVDAGVIEASEAPPRQGKQSDAVHRRATKSPGEGGEGDVDGSAVDGGDGVDDQDAGGEQSDAVPGTAGKPAGGEQSDAVPGTAGKPAGGDADADADRAARLIAAIGALAADKPQERQENLKYWTASGKPKTEALEAASGLDNVSAVERDAAWQNYLAGNGAS